MADRDDDVHMVALLIQSYLNKVKRSSSTDVTDTSEESTFDFRTIDTGLFTITVRRKVKPCGYVYYNLLEGGVQRTCQLAPGHDEGVHVRPLVDVHPEQAG